MKRPLLLLIVLAGAAAVLSLGDTPVPPPSLQTDRDPEGRVARARARCEATIRDRFRKASVAYPPAELFVRAFKHEGVVEAWAADRGAPFRLIHPYPITAASGRPGPKRREGDRQVPEGFYFIEQFNPISLFHLSLRLNYPNAADRILSDREKPGFDIYIHGSNRTVGCLPIGDEGIEELYVMASDAGNRDTIPLHLFPAQMSGASWTKFTAPYREDSPELIAFWGQLQPVYDAFERSRRVPEVTVAPDGAYRLRH